MVEVIRVSDLDAVIQEAHRRFLQVIDDVVSNGGVHGDGVARIVLTGGGAGIGLLKELSHSSIDWSKIHGFFGDERNVPVTHPDSNEGQAREVLLNRIAIPSSNIHGFHLNGGEMSTPASAYSECINKYAPRGFDLHLLGMGGEGHINSLFPDSSAIKEDVHLVSVVTDSPKPPAQRVSLTLPAVNSSARVWLLVAGAEKAEAAQHVVAASPADQWPAAGVHGTKETLLILDNSAAQLL
ncbi:6-phosphogluconolactonase [Corynebacterium diphtheriae]